MNKSEFITEIKAKTGFKKKDIEYLLDTMLDTIMTKVIEEDKVSFIGFGAFSAMKLKERKGMNPNTKESIIIPPRVQAKFTVGQVFKDTINNREVSTKFKKKIPLQKEIQKKVKKSSSTKKPSNEPNLFTN